MAETEQITILKLRTEGAESVKDLRENIKALKKVVEETKVDSEEYADALNLLKVNQNALKDAMYATSSSMDAVKKSATGAGESYNALVHRMAALKEEFRSTEDAMRRADIGKQIKEVNDQLKVMDAMQGNFQRNVGNYRSVLSGLGDGLDAFRKGLGAADGGLRNMKDGVEALQKSPAIATFSILASVVLKLADELKDNETAMAGLKKAMAALQPVMDFFSGIIEQIAGFLADIITEVAEFVSSNGLFQKVITGVMGVGNAILQFVVAPFKGVIAAIKVFKEQGVRGLGDAARAFGQEMKSGVSFKQNFQAGQAVAETLISGAKSKKKAVKDAGKDLGKDIMDGLLKELDNLSEEIDKQMEAEFAAWEKTRSEANKIANGIADDRIKAIDKAADHQIELNGILVEDERTRAEREYEIQANANQRKLTLLDQFMQDALDRDDLEAFLAYDQERADLEVEIETNALKEKKRLREQDLKDAETKAKAQKEMLKGVASATSSILGTIADLYEGDEKNAEKNANRIKALRIAAATIDTISGAIGAYMQAVETIPPPYGIIAGAAQAAAVTAAGIAQIAQIKRTKVSASAGDSSSPVNAITPAPALVTEVSNVRSITSASEEDRLNQMASDQRVYILASDIQASQNQIKTQVSESSF